MRMVRSLIVASFMATVPFVLSASALAKSEAAQMAPEVSLDELSKLVDSKAATIVDVNSTDSYKEGHVPGAISFEKHKADFASVLPKDKSALIVAYCGGPMCTAWEEAAVAAKKLGYTNIKHFKGGLKVWKDSKKTLEKAS